MLPKIAVRSTAKVVAAASSAARSAHHALAVAPRSSCTPRGTGAGYHEASALDARRRIIALFAAP
jgi:hypothetical protein